MTAKPPAGKLERVDLRACWENEALDFTPWLAQDANIRLLSEALGLELEVQRVEASVGPFRADILCQDSGDDSVVLIENQLERTNHRHLGQILTYAAGLDAVSVVWLAGKFHEEHRAALDWLNRRSDEELRFFGVEVELWRIGDSPIAPKFNVVVMPNDWVKAVSESGKSPSLDSETKALRHEYWTALMAFMEAKASKLQLKGRVTSAWLGVTLGKAGTRLGTRFSVQHGDTAVYFVIEGRRAQSRFKALETRRGQVEKELGFAPEWMGSDRQKRQKVQVSLPLDVTDKSRWPEAHAWVLDKLEAFDRVFRPLVQTLDTAATSDETDEDDEA